jgi:prepilin-type N-terminal cleavage/methylation domain-containing protein
MIRPKNASGFSLIELMLVLAILGIISAIAIPSFLGQRRRARVIGDAQSNAAALRMQMEVRKADAGVYGTAAQSYAWTAGAFTGTASANPAPNFTPGNTKMNYAITVGSTGLTYNLTVRDPMMASAIMYQTNQNGSNLFTLK